MDHSMKGLITFLLPPKLLERCSFRAERLGHSANRIASREDDPPINFNLAHPLSGHTHMPCELLKTEAQFFAASADEPAELSGTLFCIARVPGKPL